MPLRKQTVAERERGAAMTSECTFDLVDDGPVKGRVHGGQVLQVLQDVNQLVGRGLVVVTHVLVVLHRLLQ